MVADNNNNGVLVPADDAAADGISLEDDVVAGEDEIEDDVELEVADQSVPQWKVLALRMLQMAQSEEIAVAIKEMARLNGEEVDIHSLFGNGLDAARVAGLVKRVLVEDVSCFSHRRTA